MREVFAEHQPSVVFHCGRLQARAADGGEPGRGGAQQRGRHAHRAAAAGEACAERFVLVSTDKAVSPATVMGASKALAEWAIEAAQNRWKGTRFASVRFGNVLGSVRIGSADLPPADHPGVAGHRDRREDDALLMTIPEAVQLIIRSGELSTGGEVFVLEMGDPVKIIELATKHDPLAGLEPEVDIGVEIIGRRPGEKIHEELFNPGERLEPTPADKIVCAVHPSLDPAWVESAFLRIEELAPRAMPRPWRPRWPSSRSSARWPSGRLRPGDRGRPGGRRGSTVRPLPEIVQEIGAIAGLAAVVGLAVLSVLYFSQARDVKRLREWAAAHRSEPPRSAGQQVPGRVRSRSRGQGQAGAQAGRRPQEPAERRGGGRARSARPARRRRRPRARAARQPVPQPAGAQARRSPASPYPSRYRSQQRRRTGCRAPRSPGTAGPPDRRGAGRGRRQARPAGAARRGAGSGARPAKPGQPQTAEALRAGPRRSGAAEECGWRRGRTVKVGQLAEGVAIAAPPVRPPRPPRRPSRRPVAQPPSGGTGRRSRGQRPPPRRRRADRAPPAAPRAPDRVVPPHPAGGRPPGRLRRSPWGGAGSPTAPPRPMPQQRRSSRRPGSRGTGACSPTRATSS